MESISTPRRSGLPWAANLATLTVVVVTTWWSGAQRPAIAPAAQAEQSVQTTPDAALPSSQPANDSHPQMAEPLPLRVKADGTGATVTRTALVGDVIQTVGYKSAGH